MHYHARHLERLPLGTPYTDVAERVLYPMGQPELGHKPVCVVDATGVGRAVIDLTRKAGLPNLWAITITGGIAVNQPYRYEYTVPKRDLVSTLQVLLQNRRLCIAARLLMADHLRRELETFRVELRPTTGHATYGTERAGDHDDFVISLVLASWYAETYGAPWHSF